MSKDWRLDSLENQPYLRDVHWVRKRYRAYRPGWDHDHCVACWAKLAEPGIEGGDVIHEGYATTADFIRGAEYEWLCVPCFDAFGGMMGWVDATNEHSN